MRTWSLLLILGILLTTSCISDKPGAKESSMANDFAGLNIDFKIEQSGRDIYPENGIIVLKRSPFTIKLKIKRDQDLYFNFCLNDKLYNAVNQSADFTGILGFDGTGMAEGDGNPDKEIWITPDGWHVWYVTPKGEGRFDKIVKSGKSFLAERTVNSIYDIDNKKSINFDQLETIYMVCSDTHYNKNKKTYKSIKAGALKIVFE